MISAPSLYGLYEAQQDNAEPNRLLVVEGYMDVVALAQYAIRRHYAVLCAGDGEDPDTEADTLVRKEGKEAFEARMEQAMPHCLSLMPLDRHGRLIRCECEYIFVRN